MKNLFKIIFSLLTVFIFNLNNVLAHTETCFVDGKEVSCDVVKNNGILVFGLWTTIILIISILIISIFCLVFWFMMIVHAIKNNVKHKVIWIIVMTIFGILPAIFYYIFVKRPFDKKELVTVEKIKN